jgi:3-hydroxybutyryl-CoA dehydrogenase
MTNGRIAVLGAGTMGMGIAQLAITRGFAAQVFDVKQEQLDKSKQSAENRLARQVKKGKIDQAACDAALGRLALSTDLGVACKDADVVIEAVPENMDLKVSLFGEVKGIVPAHCLLASNTSSLSITELGNRVGEAERVVGLHFFNPPPVMPLIEIVKGMGTTEATVTRAIDLVKALGKESIVVKDFPGFASSRMGVALGAEAARMVESGVADVASIDKAMELGYAHPMGPLKLTDLVGLDVRLMILEHLHKELGEQFRPPALLRQMVRAGRLGKKTGHGFYRWTEDGPVAD